MLPPGRNKIEGRIRPGGLVFATCVLEREKGGREREGERNNDLFFHLFTTHLLVDSSMCPDRGSNPQPWHVGMMLQLTEPPG